MKRAIASITVVFIGWAGVTRGQTPTKTPPPATANGSSIQALQGNWENVDQRFVFLTTNLASTEASLSAVTKALATTGDSQAKQQQRADAFRGNNTRMDRNGGGPVPWQQFYGATAQNFYFHPTSTIMGASGNDVIVAQLDGYVTSVSRPPQLDYIYRANANSQAQAEAEVARIGDKIDAMVARRQKLEDEQSSLWCKIALRALTTRELEDKPIYHFEPMASESDEIHKQQLATVGAGAKFMRTINAAVFVAQNALDADQGATYTKLASLVTEARKEFKTVLLMQTSLTSSMEAEQSPLGQFAKSAKRLEDSSQNLADAFGLAREGDKAGDFQRKQNFRAQVQLMTIDG